MKLRKIKPFYYVLGLKVPVKLVKEFPGYPMRLGQFSSKGGAHIEIRSDLTPQEKHETLLHELGHALMWRIGMHNTAMPSDLEEIIVETYANFIKENFK